MVTFSSPTFHLNSITSEAVYAAAAKANLAGIVVKSELPETFDSTMEFVASRINSTQYQCTYCDFSTKKSFNYKRHVRSVHENERNYICKIDSCWKRFKLSHHLKAHQQIHNGIKFDCNFCDKRLSDKSNLIKHMRSKHGASLRHPSDFK